MTMMRIGRGLFTNAYLHAEGHVVLNSCDSTKEALALGFVTETKYVKLPEIEREEYGVRVNKYGLLVSRYKMPYYEPVRSVAKQLNDEAREIYNELDCMFNRRWGVSNTTKPSQFGNDLYETIGDTDIPHEYKEELWAIIDDLRQFGDVGFEISRRNIAATENGDLIFRDCFFIVSELYTMKGM